MATQRIVNIGFGQTTGNLNEYASYVDFWNDIGVGLPADISLMGADEDWLLLFYTDFSTQEQVLSDHALGNKLVSASGSTITFRPAVGHSLWDNINLTAEALTFYGAPKGVTFEIGAGGVFTGAPVGGDVVIDPGFQFVLNGAGASVAVNGAGLRNHLSGCIIYDERTTGFADAFGTSSSGTGTVNVENNIFLLKGGRAVNAASLSATSRVSGNMVVYRGNGTNSSAAFYTDNGDDPAAKQFYNNLVFGFDDVYESNVASKVAAFITDAASQNNSDIDGSLNTVFGADPQTVFETFPFDPSLAVPSGFDLRLQADGAAVGRGVAHTGVNVLDAAGADRAGPFDCGPFDFQGTTPGEQTPPAIFDGSGQRLARSTPLDGAFGGAGFSFYAKFNSANAGLGTNQVLISNKSYSVYVRLTSTGRIRVNLKNSAGTVFLSKNTAATNLFDGQDHEIWISYDGASAALKMYVDGVSSILAGNTQTTGTVYYDGDYWTIGSDWVGNDEWDGRLYRLCLWNDVVLDCASAAVRKDMADPARAAVLGNNLVEFYGPPQDWNSGTNHGSGGAFDKREGLVTSEPGVPYREILNDALWEKLSWNGWVSGVDGFDCTGARYDLIRRDQAPLGQTGGFDDGFYLECKVKAATAFVGPGRYRLLRSGVFQPELYEDTAGNQRLDLYVWDQANTMRTASFVCPVSILDDGSFHTVACFWNGRNEADNVEAWLDSESLGKATIEAEALYGGDAGPIYLTDSSDKFDGYIKSLKLANRPPITPVATDISWSGRGTGHTIAARGLTALSNVGHRLIGGTDTVSATGGIAGLVVGTVIPFSGQGAGAKNTASGTAAILSTGYQGRGLSAVVSLTGAKARLVLVAAVTAQARQSVLHYRGTARRMPLTQSGHGKAVRAQKLKAEIRRGTAD